MRIRTKYYLKTVNALSDLELKSIDFDGKKFNSISFNILSSTFIIYLNESFNEILKKLKNQENDSETELSLQVGEKFVLDAGSDNYFYFTNFANLKMRNTGSTSGQFMILFNEVI